jgi:hypothetical protein
VRLDYDALQFSGLGTTSGELLGTPQSARQAGRSTTLQTVMRECASASSLSQFKKLPEE